MKRRGGVAEKPGGGGMHASVTSMWRREENQRLALNICMETIPYPVCRQGGGVAGGGKAAIPHWLLPGKCPVPPSPSKKRQWRQAAESWLC